MKETYKHRYKLKCTFVTMQMASAVLLGVWGRLGWAGSLAGGGFGSIVDTFPLNPSMSPLFTQTNRQTDRETDTHTHQLSPDCLSCFLLFSCLALSHFLSLPGWQNSQQSRECVRLSCER